MRAPAFLAALFLVLACRPHDASNADSTTQSSGGAAAAADRYSLADFRQISWLEGRWRGGLPNGGSFYEQYRWVDDSTIVMHALADPTFARATDSARISLRDGVVANESATARWEATAVDSASVDFAPVRGASNSFRWMRESPTRWTATLRSTDREGRSRETVYRMERVGSQITSLPACPSGPGPDARWPRVDLGSLSMQLPADYARREVQGIDSHVGQYVAEGRTLGFDFGAYSNPLSSSDNALRDARACRERIAGRDARIVVARRDSGYFAGAAWRNVGQSAVGAMHLTITVEARDSLGQAEALRIFRGVRLQ